MSEFSRFVLFFSLCAIMLQNMIVTNEVREIRAILHRNEIATVGSR